MKDIIQNQQVILGELLRSTRKIDNLDTKLSEMDKDINNSLDKIERKEKKEKIEESLKSKEIKKEKSSNEKIKAEESFDITNEKPNKFFSKIKNVTDKISLSDSLSKFGGLLEGGSMEKGEVKVVGENGPEIIKASQKIDVIPNTLTLDDEIKNAFNGLMKGDDFNKKYSELLKKINLSQPKVEDVKVTKQEVLELRKESKNYDGSINQDTYSDLLEELKYKKLEQSDNYKKWNELSNKLNVSYKDAKSKIPEETIKAETKVINEKLELNKTPETTVTENNKSSVISKEANKINPVNKVKSTPIKLLSKNPTVSPLEKALKENETTSSIPSASNSPINNPAENVISEKENIESVNTKKPELIENNTESTDARLDKLISVMEDVKMLLMSPLSIRNKR